MKIHSYQLFPKAPFLWYIPHKQNLSSNYFCRGEWWEKTRTQGFIFVKKTLYHSRLNFSPHCYGYFERVLFQTIWESWPRISIIHIWAYKVPRITKFPTSANHLNFSLITIVNSCAQTAGGLLFGTEEHPVAVK
jgi:hypothetical protein